MKDVTSGFQVGELCRFCALNEFGESLSRGLWKRSDGCAVCNRDGHIAIVEREPRVKEDGGRRVVSHELASVPSMLLCDEHAHQVLNERERTAISRNRDEHRGRD